MAEHKYELWTIPSRNKTPKHYPWYSERLRQKYLSTKPSGSLLSSNWVFVKDGGDDYRTGVPRETMSAQPYLTKKDGQRHPALVPRQLPPINNLNISQEQSARFSKSLDKRTIVFSKKVPRKEAQMKYIDVIEDGLTGHPLAVFPHYEEAVAPELFEEIVEALDPDVRQDSSSDLTDSTDEESQEDVVSETEESKKSQSSPSPNQLGAENKSGGSIEHPQLINSFKWYPCEEPFDETNSSPGVQERGSGHTKIQSVTKDFCDWVRELGGDPNDAHVNNIEESTIFSLFASGYETKPALSVPIHVVQLSDVPLELRNGAMVSPDLPSLLQYGIKNLTIRRGDTPSKHKGGVISRNHWIRHQYGAWYLPVDLWRHKNSPSGLSDPQEDTMKTVSEAKLKSRELDSTLSTMHGAMSFREYVDRKNLRRPDFLHCVDPLTKEDPNISSAKSARGGSCC